MKTNEFIPFSNSCSILTLSYSLHERITYDSPILFLLAVLFLASLDLDSSDANEPSFYYNVSATDNGTSTTFTTYKVIYVSINRVNEYTPVFATSGVSLTIMENATVGDVIYQVRWQIVSFESKILLEKDSL